MKQYKQGRWTVERLYSDTWFLSLRSEPVGYIDNDKVLSFYTVISEFVLTSEDCLDLYNLIKQIQ